MISRVENVLATRNPSVTDENSWEEFTLTDVKAFVPGKRRFANILCASEETPVCVVGKLGVLEKQQKKLVRDRNYEFKHVLIENVTYYAYGQTRDGQVVIWVAGAPGWFAISPSRTYKAVYNEMVEAIDLLYFTADKHQHVRSRWKKAWNPKVNFLFKEYSKHTIGSYEDEEESAELYYRHHEFLIIEMLKGREGIDWSRTPIFSHLCERYPETFQRLRQFVDANASASDDDDEDDDDDSSNISEPDEDTEGGTSHTLSHAAQKAQADSIFAAIQDIKDSMGASKRRLNIRTVAKTLFTRYEITSVEYAIDLVCARAPLLLDLMDKSSTAHFMWASRAIYLELNAVQRNEGTEVIGSTPLHPRLNGCTKSTSANNKDNEDSAHNAGESHDDNDDNDNDNDGDEEDEDDEEDETPPPVRRRAPKSILRPRPTKSLGKRAASKGGGKSASKSAGKGKKRMLVGGSNAHVNGDDDLYLSDESDYIGAIVEDTPSRVQALEDLLDMEIQSSNEGEHEDGQISLLEMPANVKEQSETQINGTDAGINTKGDCDGQEEPQYPQQATNGAKPDDSEEKSEEKRFGAGLSHAMAFYPHLPADTWVCPVEGCMKTVYKVSSRYSRDAINDHALSHADDSKTRISLVFSEQKYNVGLSVSHLVDRIKDFAEAGELVEGDEIAAEDAHESLAELSQEISPPAPKRMRLEIDVR